VILSEADHAGVEVVFVTEPLDDSPEGQLIRFVRGYAAKLEHEKIKERTMRGRRARIDGGKPPVGARPTYGYRWAEDRDKDGKPIKQRLAEHPETAQIVRRIFAEVANGRSARQVARSLTNDGVPTPTGKKVWHASSLSGILHHPTYVGDVTAWRWKHSRIKGKVIQSRRPVEDQVVLQGVAPALVPRETALAARSRLAANKQVSVRNNRNPEAFLLRGGIARCGYCGSACQADNGRWGPVYRCNTTARDRHNCPHFSIKAEILDSAVWEGIRERLMNPEVITAELQRLRTTDPTRHDIDAITRRFREVDRKQRNLMDRLAEENDADIATLIRADLVDLVNEKRRLEQEREALDRQRQGWQLAQDQLIELDRWLDVVAVNLDTLDYSQKRLALEALGATVRVWSTEHTPRWDISLRPDFLTTTIGACGTL
jgi:site-specific DNA recombinase